MEMKIFALASASLFALGALSSADAADLPLLPAKAVAPAPYYDWSGFYTGINGGGGLAHSDWAIVSFNNVAIDPAVGEGRHNAAGGTVGGQFGYRWQFTKWIIGLEAQGNWADFGGSNFSITLPPLVNQSKVEAFGLFTAQVGYTANNLMLYGKAGAGVASVKFNSFVTGGVSLPEVHQTRVGPTLGIGVEYGFAENWSVGGEYDHLFLGHKTAELPTGRVERLDSIGQDVDVALIRINYRWGNPAAPVVVKY
jgi:outer membrane immunogenic protein